MSSAQYKRVGAIWLIKPDNPVKGFLNDTGVFGDFFKQGPNAIIVRSPFRMQFKIEKNLGKEPNKAECVITNLAPTTRADIEKKPLLVRIEAGYESDANLEQVFVGDLRKGFTQRTGTDWETKLLMGDGDRGFRFAELSRSYIPGTRVKQVLDDITGAIGLKLPPSIAGALEFEHEYAGGYVADGTAEQELTHVLTPLGMSWSIQDGELQVLREGEPAPGEAHLIEEDNGMIGSPEFGDPTKPGKPPILKVACSLRPKIKCGATIRVQARDIQGLFRVEKLTHTGDTRGKDWKTEIEGLPL